jgi:streptogramin lyase
MGWVFATVLAACGDDAAGPTGAGDLATIKLDLGLAPANARCAIITVTPMTGTAVTQQIALVPEQSTVFTLSNLPTGTVTVTQQVFTVACAMTAGAQPTWVADPVTVTLQPGTSVDITFTLNLVAGGGTIVAHDDFPATQSQFTAFPGAHDIVAITTGPDANLWFVNQAFGLGVVGRLTTSGVTTYFDVAPGFAGGITAGPDGNLWITLRSNPSIGVVNTSGSLVAQFALPSSSSNPQQISAGRDGNLWFADPGVGQIGRITPSGVLTMFNPLTSSVNGLQGICAGSDGNMWFTESTANRIGRITPTGSVTEFTVPTPNAAPFAITAGPDGNVWFTEEIGRIGRIGPTGGIVEFPLFAFMPGIATGPDGNLWAAMQAPTAGIARITPLGVITQFTSGAVTFNNTFSVTAGPDGNVWVGQLNAQPAIRVHP